VARLLTYITCPAGIGALPGLSPVARLDRWITCG